MKLGGQVAILVVFGVFGLTQFAENVRTVQVLGLFACGAVVGASLTRIIATLKARKQAKQP